MAHLPTFLIIGAARSGTTALYHILDQHPDVYMSPVKEPNFFAYGGHPIDFQGPGDDQSINSWSVTTLDNYQSLFADAHPDQARGEASPSSLYVPRAAQRIQHFIPDARLIVLLRNPVERAYSNYLLLVRDGREPSPTFSEALQQEAKRIRQGWEHVWHYIQLGFYARQLEQYMQRFPTSHLQVYLHDDLVTEPDRVLRDIFQFIAVDPSFAPDTSTQYNPSGAPHSETLHWLLHHAGLGKKVRDRLPDSVRAFASTHLADAIKRVRTWKAYLMAHNLTKPPMDPSVRRKLQALYRDDILRLQDLIDRDLSHWLDS